MGNSIDQDAHKGALGPAHDALNKMKRASERGTGTYLSKEEVQSLSLTLLGELWEEEDPRTKKP